MLVINCSCLNNSVKFFDPESMQIFKMILFSPADYKMTQNFGNVIEMITPTLQNWQKNGLTFEKGFEGKIKTGKEGS